jgi:TonB family protein
MSMKFVAQSVALAAVVGAALTTGSPAAAKRPKTEWITERGAHQCSLRNTKRSGFEIELSDSFGHVTLFALRFSSNDFQRRPAVVLLRPSGERFEVPKSGAAWLPGGFAVDLPARFTDDLARSTGLAIEVNGSKKFDFSFEPPLNDVRTLHACHETLLRSWGIDPHQSASLSKEAVPVDGGSWITNKDFEKIGTEAMARHGGGTTIMTYAVNPAGRVTDCRTVVSSGFPTLDRFACTATTERGRFEPALDASGNPTTQRVADVIRWLFVRP